LGDLGCAHSLPNHWVRPVELDRRRRMGTQGFRLHTRSNSRR